jgi:heme-degrading monooxygenase HmoA
MAVTLINVFTVKAESVDEYLRNWTLTTEVFKTKPGFIETHLHRNTGVGNQTFQFINIARWTSREAWKQTHDDYRPTEYTIEGVVGHPAIFETIINVYSDTLSQSERSNHWIGSPPPADFVAS